MIKDSSAEVGEDRERWQSYKDIEIRYIQGGIAINVDGCCIPEINILVMKTQFKK